MHLLGRCPLLEALSGKEGLIAAPDERREALLGHEAWRADIAEAVFAPLHEGHEPVTLQDEMGSDFRRDDLNPGIRKLLENFDHAIIVYIWVYIL